MFSVCENRTITVELSGDYPPEPSKGQFKREPWKRSFIVKEWHNWDPFPELGNEVGIDTETLRFSAFNPYPDLVVLGVYNPKDNTCYVVPFEDYKVFMNQLLLRDVTIYLANAGYDHYVMKEIMKDFIHRGKVIDILIRSQLYEISTIGFQLSYSLQDACKWRIGYAMDKHEEDGDDSLRVNFKKTEVVTEDQLKYLGIDCYTTWMIGNETPSQPTEVTDTKGSIVLNRTSSNGITVDNKVFEAFEKALMADKETFRQQLLTYGFPDPEAKKEKPKAQILEEEWPNWQRTWLKNVLPEESYVIPFSMPLKQESIRMLIYAAHYMEKKQAPEVFARSYVIIRDQCKNKNLKKAEQKAFDSLVEEFDFLEPLLALRKQDVWQSIAKFVIDKHLEGAGYEETFEELDLYIQERTDWFAVEPPIGPVAFLQNHLTKLEEEYQGMVFARTKTGKLRCSKKDSWLLEDHEVKDPFINAYMNYIHVNKYLSTYVNREYTKEDGKVHPRFGMVTSARTNCVRPNA